MAIKTIRVKNFKSFKDVEVHLGNFNVLIGANASGKSNFIQIIQFLRDIQRHGLDNAISLQGGPEYLTNLNIGTRENLSAEVVVLGDSYTEWVLIGESRSADSSLVLEPRESRYCFTVGYHKNGGGFDIVGERLSVKGEICVVPGSGTGSEQRQGHGEIVIVREGGRPSANVTLPEGLSLDQYEVVPRMSPDILGRLLFLQYAPFSSGVIMEDVAIYDFDPKLPKKGTPITGKAELEEDGSNLAIVLKRIMEDESARRNLTNLLQYLLPYVADLDVERFADKSLLFSLREKFAENKPVPASSISDGTINVAALIVALYFERKPIAIFEEPERNVHPHLISRIVGMMKEASQLKQIIVTTHNPEVVRNTDIADVHLVSRDAEGFSTITKPSEQEDVKGFLQNEIGLEELFVQNLLHN